MFPRDASLDTHQPLYDLTTSNPNWRQWNSTFWYGTPQFMVYVTDLLVLLLTGRKTAEIELAFLPMKTEAFTQMEPMAAQNLTFLFPFFILCVYLLPLYYMVTKLAEEKESRGREGMIMMGLKHHTYFIAWWVFLFTIVFGMSAILVLTASLKIFVKSNLWLVFTMCLLYGMTMYGFAFIIVALFPTKKSSATAASLIHLLSYYVGFMYSGHQTNHLVKIAVSLIPNAALTFMLEHLLQCEFQGSGLSLEFAAMEVQGFSFNRGLQMMAVDVIVLAFLGFYLDQVLPKQYGVARPWNFLCQRRKANQILRKSIQAGDEVQDQEKVSKGNFEEVSPQIQRDSYSLKIRNLRHVYSNGKIAVQDTSMTMYSGQIFALLGHNGAGKTTTIQTLTGLLKPTHGKAELEGLDIFEKQDKFRENLGVCPQHNVLFDYLTVREHLELYAAFKGVSNQIIKKKVEKMLYEIELVDNQHQLAKTLSGGQRRKLSVAIALIGDAKVIMLDEPTSGMDTTTRRRFWEMVKQYKEGRIIVLTTHYMDEADILGDRICIMAEGSVQCCGSSLFLKNRFGAGYNLVLAKQQAGGLKSEIIHSFIKKRLPEATKLQEVSTEINYQLPISVSSKFKDFFADLDKDLSKLGLSSYGVGITTLEEVFLRIGHGEEHATTIDRIKAQTADLSKLTPREKVLTEYSIATDHQRNFLNHFCALVKKKVLVMVRDPKSFVMDFFFPIILIFVGLYVSQIDLLSQEYPKRALTAYGFPTGRPLIYNQHNFNQTEDEVHTFVRRGFGADVGEGKLFSHYMPVETNLSAHFFEQAAEIDDVVFEQRHKSGASYGGSFLVQQVSPEDRYYAIAMFVNASSPAASMSYASYALQGVLRDMTNNPTIRLNFHEKPLPFGFKLQSYINAAQGTIAGMGIAVAYMMMADQIVQSLIKERQTNVKHQIMVSGASKLAYWTSNFFVDFLYHQLIALIARISIHCLGIDAPDNEKIFFTFSLVNPLFVYALSFLFDTDSKASVVVRIIYFALGGVAPIAIMALQVVNERTIEIGQMLAKYFYQWPIYNLNLAYLSVINRKMVALLRHQKENSLQPLDWEVAGEPIFNMQVCALACLIFVTIIELGFYSFVIGPVIEPLKKYAGHYYKALRPKKRVKLYSIRKDCQKMDIEASDDEEDRRNTLAARKFRKITDNDPQKEESRVAQILKKKREKNTAALTIGNLSKQFVLGEKAVDNLSFSLEFGECFALLGVTGAGKTTTFKCLTGEETPDAGTLLMGGHDVRTRKGFNQARCLIGYCPQFDAIFEHLTVMQHLDFYASIKGVRSDYKKELIAKQIKEMDLTDFVNVNAGQLSGGNKRKLQCAIALIGNPPIVLLDEPSTGVDPQAKRFMWTIISNISTLRKQSTVVLTTHSMEEAEALCTKMGIMVDGHFKCFGSSQHIKNKYGMGFELEIKFRTLSDAEIAAQKEKHGVTSEAVTKVGLDALMRKIGYADLTREICEGGLGSDLNRVLTNTGKLYVHELIRWAHIERNGNDIIAQLEKVFSEFQLVEHFSNSYTFKVSRDLFSIGAVFGMLEDFKQKYSIQEYSVQQTSLEQIFNIFAMQAGSKESVSLLKKLD